MRYTVVLSPLVAALLAWTVGVLVLAFVGIDVVDGHLTEANVTSPTGLRQRCDLSGERPDLRIVLWLEDHVGRFRSSPPRDGVCEDPVDD